jgi:signal transduction histidine kinase
VLQLEDFVPHRTNNPTTLLRNNQVRTLDVLAVIVVVAMILLSAAVLRFQKERRSELVNTVHERNVERMNITADTVTDYFDSIRTVLQVISHQPGILAAKSDAHEQIVQTYNLLWVRHGVTSMLITPVTEEGMLQPVLHLTHGESRPTVPADGSRPNEIVILNEQRHDFDNNSKLTSLFSRQVELCGNTDGVPPMPGYVFTTPIRDGDQLTGMLTLTVTSELISELLERGSNGSMAVLINESAGLLGCEDFPETLRNELNSQMAITPPVEYFMNRDSEAMLGSWTMQWRSINLHNSEQWWLAHYYLEEQELAAIGNGFVTKARQSLALVIIVGLGLTGLLVSARSRLLARISCLKERAKDDELLHSVAMGTSGVTGEEFFRVLSRSLATAFDVRYVHVSSLDENDPTRARTLAFWDGETFRPTINYDIADSPSELILNQGRYMEADGLDGRFDNDDLLHELGVVSYVGTTLYDAEGEPFGVLVVMDTKPFHQPQQRVDSILQIFATRASAELDRLRSDQRIQKMNEKLERRFEIRSAELRSAQGQLVEVEKMAALGTLVSGVAHEINGPVGIGVTAVTHLQDQLASFRQDFQSGGLTKKKLDVFLEGVRESSSLVYSNLKRAAELIKVFKQVTADGEGEESRRVRLGDHMQQALLDLRPALQHGAHQVSISCPDGFEVETYPNAVRGLINELITNSIVYGFNNREGGVIGIEIFDQGPTWSLVYTDDGCGMDDVTAQRMFDPFFTSDRGRRGTGLGMHIAYNTVTRTLGGTIRCETAPDKGVRFEIVCPELVAVTSREPMSLVS